jgi:SAM-dependent methyltransferase
LRRLYEEWYAALVSRLPHAAGGILELGSGAGFLGEFVPSLISSEVFACPDIRVVLDARRLPFSANSLRAILMTDVLHHIPDPKAFFAEARRTLVLHGRIVMIEPWATAWARFVYTYLHSEPFNPDAADWGFPPAGPLSSANGAMPWIIFSRDRAAFTSFFPEFVIREIALMMPVSYLASGGVSMRSLSPGWSYPLWRCVERLLAPLNPYIAMFAMIDIERTGP